MNVVVVTVMVESDSRGASSTVESGVVMEGGEEQEIPDQIVASAEDTRAVQEEEDIGGVSMEPEFPSVIPVSWK